MRDQARELRRHQTEAEAVLWQRLRNRQLAGMKFRRQRVVGMRFIADFCCVEHKLIIEVDGGIHDTEQQQNHDQARSEIIQGLGFRVLRFTNEQVLHNTDLVCETIASIVTTLPSPKLHEKNSIVPNPFIRQRRKRF